jgi:GcrA cell cycle regulator
VWTDASFQRLAELAAQKLSARAIADTLAREFKVRVTRNAVIGKARRTGIKLHAPAGFPSSDQSPPKVSQRRRVENRVGRDAEKGLRLLTRHADGEGVPAPTFQREFLSLGDGNCHWPIGDPGTADFKFCGAPTRGYYCAYHWNKAHR